MQNHICCSPINILSIQCSVVSHDTCISVDTDRESFTLSSRQYRVHEYLVVSLIRISRFYHSYHISRSVILIHRVTKNNPFITSEGINGQRKAWGVTKHGKTSLDICGSVATASAILGLNTGLFSK